MPEVQATGRGQADEVKRTVNYRKNEQIEYVFSMEEFTRKLGIPEHMISIYFSTSNRTVKVICKKEDK